jgi:hypothetical protein
MISQTKEIQYSVPANKKTERGRVVMCPITKEIREIMDKRYGGLNSIPEQYINEHTISIGLEPGVD